MANFLSVPRLASEPSSDTPDRNRLAENRKQIDGLQFAIPSIRLVNSASTNLATAFSMPLGGAYRHRVSLAIGGPSAWKLQNEFAMMACRWHLGRATERRGNCSLWARTIIALASGAISWIRRRFFCCAIQLYIFCRAQHTLPTAVPIAT